MMEECPVQIQNKRDVQRLVLVLVLAKKHVERVAIPRELLLVAVAEAGRTLRDPFGAFGVDDNALNRVGGRDRRDPGVL